MMVRNGSAWDSMDLKRIMVWVMVLSLVLLLGSVVYSSRETLEFRYHVQVTPSQDLGYVLYIPLPVVSYGMKVISGELSYELVDTEHGEAMKITSNDSVVLEFRGEDVRYELFEDAFRDDHYALSTQKDINDDGKISWSDDAWYWFFFDNMSSGNTLELTMNFEMEHARNVAYGTNYHRNATTELSGGWELVECLDEGDTWDGGPLLSPVCCSGYFIVMIAVALAIIWWVEKEKETDEQMTDDQGTRKTAG